MLSSKRGEGEGKMTKGEVVEDQESESEWKCLEERQRDGFDDERAFVTSALIWVRLEPSSRAE